MAKKTKKRVLLVDDETDFLEIMGQTIESWGYEVIRASNGSEAEKRLSDSSPDIVILDYIMPDIDGVSLLKKMRLTNKEVPVVMFTAKPDTQAIKETTELKITAFVPKLSPYVDTQTNLKSALNMAFKKA